MMNGWTNGLRGLLAIAGLLLGTRPGHGQETQPPTADAVKALAARYQAERATAVKTGLAARFLPALLERADVLAKKGEAARAAGRLLQASETLRQARWQLPYQAPGTPTEHVARILGNARLRHGKPILSVAFSPDGQRLATASADRTVKIWDLANGHELRTYGGHDDAVRLVAFSPDGQTVASAGFGSPEADARIRLWDPATGKDRRSLKVEGGVYATALAFARDGKSLIVGWAGKPGTDVAAVLACFDPETGAVQRRDADFRARISSLAVSSDGAVVAVGVEDGQVRLWQYPALRENPKAPAYWMKQHDTGAIHAVAFSPDGKTLACSGPFGSDSIRLYATPQPGGGLQVDSPRLSLPSNTMTKALAFSKDGKALFAGAADGLIRFWDPENGQLLGSFQGHAGEVRALAFNPAGNQLASAGFDYTVHLWDFDIVLQARDLAIHDGPVWSAAFSPDGGRIITASADRTAKVWDLAAGKVVLTLTGHNAPVTAALFSPDGTFIASGGSDKTLRLWDAATGAARPTGAGHTGTITALDISADNTRVVTGAADRRVKVWDAATGKELRSIDDQPSLVAAVAFSPNGKQIAVGNVDQAIRLYDAATGKLEQQWMAHAGAVSSIAYSPNGQLLVSGGNDGLVKVWPLATAGENPVVLSGHTGPVSGVAFRKDNQHVASASADHLVKLWKVEGSAGKEVQTFRGHKDWVASVAFNPDGFYLVSAGVDRLVKVWEITSRAAPLLAEHTAAVNTVAVSPDGKQIASGSDDKTIKVWDLATGVELASLHGHGAGVTAVAYTPGRNLLVSSGEDKNIRLWDPVSFREIPRTGEQELYFKNMTDASPYLFVTPDGQRLFAWFLGRQSNLSTLVEGFELGSGKRLFNFTETKRKVHSLAFCPNGKLAATGAVDGTVRLWNLEEKRAEAASGGDWSFFPGSGANAGVADLAIAPDGNTLVVTSNKGEVHIAEIGKRAVRQKLIAHKDTRILGCLISPDGKRFVTLGGDNVVKCWDLETGKELRQWVMGSPTEGRGALVAAAAFTPDSRQLVTGNADTTLFVLDLP